MQQLTADEKREVLRGIYADSRAARDDFAQMSDQEIDEFWIAWSKTLQGAGWQLGQEFRSLGRALRAAFSR